MGKLKSYIVIANTLKVSYAGLDEEETWGRDCEVMEESAALGIYIAESEDAAISSAIKENSQYNEIWDIRVYEINSTYKSKKSYICGCLLEDKVLTIPYGDLNRISEEYAGCGPNLDPDIVVAIDLKGSNVDLAGIQELTTKAVHNKYAGLDGKSNIWWVERLKYIINPPNKEIGSFIKKWSMSRI